MKKENFARVYEEYHKLVLHIAFDGLKDYDLAQDVCQEVFIAFSEKIDGLDEELVKGWFVKNANRKTVDVQRKPYRKNEISGEIKDEMCPQVVVEYLVEEDEGRRNEFRQFLLEKLKEKNPVWYDLMILVVVEKESTKAVAQEYGMTVVNLRMKISRARHWRTKNYYEAYQEL